MSKKIEKSHREKKEDRDQEAQFDLRPVPRKMDGALVAYDPLQMYLWEMRKYKLLTREEELELAIRYREQNDQRAAHTLILSNLRLVVKIAMDFHKYWMKNLMDLIQEGNVGLLQAVRKFDPDGTRLPVGYPCKFHELLAQKVSHIAGIIIDVNTSSTGCIVTMKIEG